MFWWFQGEFEGLLCGHVGRLYEIGCARPGKEESSKRKSLDTCELQAHRNAIFGGVSGVRPTQSKFQVRPQVENKLRLTIFLFGVTIKKVSMAAVRLRAYLYAPSHAHLESRTIHAENAESCPSNCPSKNITIHSVLSCSAQQSLTNEMFPDCQSTGASTYYIK